MVWRVLLLVCVSLGGCVGEPGEAPSASTHRGAEPGPAHGAIDGIVVDDRFRPVGGALVLLHEVGLSLNTAADGAFYFEGLRPGNYTVRVGAQGHEAVPTTVTVEAGTWTETAVVARRTAGVAEYPDRVVYEHTLRVACQIDAVVIRLRGCLIEGEGPSDSVRLDHATLPASRMETTAWVDHGDETALSYSVCRYSGSTCVIQTYDQARGNVDQHQLRVDLWDVGPGGTVAWNNDEAFELHFSVDPRTLGLTFGLGLSLEVTAEIVHTVFLGGALTDPEGRSVSGSSSRG